MTRKTKPTVAIGAAALLAAAAWAQQGQSQKQPQESMSMGEMMKNCRQHCEATSKSIDEMTSMMNNAKSSDDPAKMRAAMDRMQEPMDEMKEHMDMCMGMMDMMERMHGMGGMMGGGHMGMMEARDAPKLTTSPEELNQLCGTDLDPQAAPRADYKGKTYYFCSKADKTRFEKDPEKYVKSPR